MWGALSFAGEATEALHLSLWALMPDHGQSFAIREDPGRLMTSLAGTWRRDDETWPEHWPSLAA